MKKILIVDIEDFEFDDEIHYFDIAIREAPTGDYVYDNIDSEIINQLTDEEAEKLIRDSVEMKITYKQAGFIWYSIKQKLGI